MIYQILLYFISVTAFPSNAIHLESNSGLSSLNAHPFHLSKCHIKYKDVESTLEVTLVLFVDDFEAALENYSNRKFHLCDEIKNDSNDVYVARYLKDHFNIKINNQENTGQFIGNECSDNWLTTWCYLEFKLNHEPSSITVFNNILLEIFSDQKNIVDVELSKGNLVEKLMSNELTEATFNK